MPASRTPTRRRPGAGRRPRRRSWLWRYRRVLFLFGLLGATAIGGVAYVIAQVPLPKDAPLAQTTILTDASGKPTEQIKAEEASSAHTIFHIITKDPEGPHIPDDVHPATMQKH